MEIENNKRIKILSQNEYHSLYDKPVFTYKEQNKYFKLSFLEKELLGKLRDTKSRLYFIIQLGYFKATHLFFVFNLEDVSIDANYIRGKYFENDMQTYDGIIDKGTRQRQQQMILELFGYSTCDDNIRRKLQEKAYLAAQICVKPIYIFREIAMYLSENKIILPKYTTMQDIVGQSLVEEQNRLGALLEQYLEDNHLEKLEQLLKNESGLYGITKVKHEPKDFKYSEIKYEIERGYKIKDLYLITQNILPKLSISNESIKYYASLINYYSVYKLKRFQKWTSYLYLLCFIHYRYQQVSDNLINAFIYKVRGYMTSSKEYAKEKVYELNLERSINIKKAGKLLKLFIDEKIALDTPFKDIQQLAFEILDKDKIIEIVNKFISNKKFDESEFQWEFIDTLTKQFQQNLKPIILNTQLDSTSKDEPLMVAYGFIKNAFIKGRSLQTYATKHFPLEFIPLNQKKYILNKNNILVNRYLFSIYILLMKKLESGDVFCSESSKYRSFEDDLIDDETWERKKELLEDMGLDILKKPIDKRLEQLENTLENRIWEVNMNIATGNNKFIETTKTKKETRWHLKYQGDSDLVNHQFFNNLPSIDITDILYFVNDRCNFSDAFEHILGRYSKQEKDIALLMACLVAWGTNMGIGKMSEISDISYHLLDSMSENFFRLETLEKANDLVCNNIFKLAIFEHQNIDGKYHSSSDAQKKEVGISTINARHSPKYFGLSKGLGEYNLILNNVPINAKIIGANEHESHFVYDIVFNNTTDIKPEIHSTDTHGTNEVNFAILDFFGYQFAPRYKDIYDVVSEQLGGFNNPSNYEGLIKPKRKINKQLIIDEWDNIRRIIASLALKSTTQSIIVRKLSNHMRRNKTKQALWEYNNIIQSIYLLNYIDIENLRKNVQLALNRGESYHKLKKAISYANFGKLRYKTEQEQRLWSACSRLVANCIIYYNASILSMLLEHAQKTNNKELVDLLKRVSPVAWQHINLFGRYEFYKNLEEINLDELLIELLMKLNGK